MVKISNIKIHFPDFTVNAALAQTKTGEAILKALPIKTKAQTWGEEIYFPIPVAPVEDPNVEEVEIGTVAYWPPGRACCIFFGRTPASTSAKPRAASAVTVIGKIKGSIGKLREVRDGDEVKLRI